MFFSCPKVFFAAESIASSSAFTMIWRSMPFSLLTCSITRFRSGCIRAPSGVGVRRPRGPAEVVFNVSFLDPGERDHGPPGVGVLDHHGIRTRLDKDPVELPPSGNRVARPHPHACPDRAAEMRLAQEWPVEAGRRALEVVPARDGVVDVEQVAELAGQPRELVQGDAAVGPVDEQTEHGAAALGAVLHVDELEPARERDGLRQLPDALGHRGPIHQTCSSKIKKWAAPTRFWSVKAGESRPITCASLPRN